MTDAEILDSKKEVAIKLINQWCHDSIVSIYDDDAQKNVLLDALIESDNFTKEDIASHITTQRQTYHDNKTAINDCETLEELQTLWSTIISDREDSGDWAGAV